MLTNRMRVVVLVLLVGPAGSPADAQPVCPTPTGPAPAPTVITYRPRIYLVWTPQGIVPYSPPLIVVAPGGGFFPPAPMPTPPLLLTPPADLPAPAPPLPVARPQAPAMQPGDSDRVKKLVTLGDRVFRAGNYGRAAERYEQALKAQPGSSLPRVRLAQVAIARGDYREAATRLREAAAAERGWLAHAGDIQTLWAEPRAFAAMLGKIESRLQAHPEDRDAWLVLGAQLFLAGRTRQAADVFLRLTDREPDRVLAAFLEETRAAE